jgi:hypothetical protein
MAKDPRFGRWLCVFVALLTALVAGAGELRAQGLSCMKLPKAGFAISDPISCTVNCSAGGTIASALALRPQTTSTLTVTIQGTCVESVDHVPGGVILQAAPSGATLQAPSSSTDPVLGISGTGVTLDNLTISGGVNALRGRSGSAFTGNNLLVEGASNADILLNHAAVNLNASTIQNSAGDGIDANYGSTVFLNGGAVQQNARTGVFASFDGSADVFGAAVLQKNGVAGAGADKGGTVNISAATVTKNAFSSAGIAGINVSGGQVTLQGSSSVVSSNNVNGIEVYDNGSIVVENGAMVANNSGNGLFVLQGGFAKVRQGAIVQGNSANGIAVRNGNVQVGDGDGPATIKNNMQNGIFMRTNSVAVLANSLNQIINNSGWGLLCTGAPSNPLIYSPIGTFGTVSGNGAGQIQCNISP